MSAQRALRRKGYRSGRVVRAAAEPLEQRVMLQATLFVDFGDRFPSGTLATTQGAFRDVANDPTPNNRILGTTLLDSANGFDAGTALNIVAQTFTANVRAQMMAVVRRAFLPMDVDVVELTATAQTTPDGRNVQAAANMNDVINTLRAGPAASRDGYVFVATFVVDPGGTNQATYGPGGGGNSPGGPNGTTLDTVDLATAVNNHDDVAVVFSAGGFSNNTLNNISHEAGHLFGMQHSITNATNNATTNLFHQAEVMSYRNTNNTTSTIASTRYPMIRGDDNSPASGNLVNYDDLAARNGQNTLYDQMRLDANILPNPDFSFVSGTGAHDIITVRRNGANADVSIQAFGDAAYTTAITVPGVGGTTYSYSFPLTNNILIFAGDSNDRIVLDADLGVNVVIDGMLGTDSLVINGKGVSSVVYTPDATSPIGVDLNVSFGGLINIGGNSITFTNYETNGSVTIDDVVNLTFRTGGSSDSVTLGAPVAGRMNVTGTSDAISFVPLTFFDVTNFTIDTGANDGATPGDTVRFQASAPASGLQTIAVNTGGGDDVLRVDFAFGNPIPTGGVSYNGGTGADLLALRGGSFTNETYTATGSNDGTIVLDGSTITFTDLAPIDDTVAVVNFTFNASGIDDVIDVLDGPSVEGFATTRIASGNAGFELINLANKTNVVIDGAAGNDTINVRNTTLSSPGLSTLSLRGSGGNDTFNVRAFPNMAIGVDGGAHTTVDRMNVDGETLDFDFDNTSFTTAGRQPINFVNVETLGLENGFFVGVGSIGPNVVVDNAATLAGVPTIAGTVSVLAGGTISPGVGGAGIMTVGGLSMVAGATYQVDLNGLTPGTQHDQLIVNGTVSLGGATLAVNLGFTPLPGEDIVLIRNDGADAVAGTFAEGSLATFNGIKFAIDYAFDADMDLNLNDVAMIRFGAALGPDPCNPALEALYVSATTGNDLIRFVPATGNSRIEVLINGVSEGVFRPSIHGLLIGYGQSGHDVIRVEVPSRKVIMYGNVGNDSIFTGNNNGILFGNVGDDVLVGGNQSDILIGGRGADLLEGGNSGDILIAGYSPTYEANTTDARHALCGILDEWTHGSGGYAGRINKITSGGGHNGTHVFNNTNIFDDAEVDTLRGGNGQDWFLMNTTGGVAIDLSDRDNKELATDLV